MWNSPAPWPRLPTTTLRHEFPLDRSNPGEDRAGRRATTGSCPPTRPISPRPPPASWANWESPFRTGSVVTNITNEGVDGPVRRASRLHSPPAPCSGEPALRRRAWDRGLAQATGAQTDRAGRVLVEPRFHPVQPPRDLRPSATWRITPIKMTPHCPAWHPLAMQEGEYVARVILNRLKGKKPDPFHYRDYGDDGLQSVGVGRWL